MEVPRYRRKMPDATAKAKIACCLACGGAFLHFRNCPYFMGADQGTIHLEAARAAKARMWA